MYENNSFLFLNSSFQFESLENFEGLVFEFKWKNQYVIICRILKINDLENYHKSIEIECLEMNHYENAFYTKISLYWDSTALQTLMIIKTVPKDKIVEEIIKRIYVQKDKDQIYQNLVELLKNDLTNLENSATTLIFGKMKDILNYLSDITKIIKFCPEIREKRIEVYQSPIFNLGRNCRVYEPKTNKLEYEFIFNRYIMEKYRQCQIRWEKKKNNELFCIYRISIIYLEDNISLLFFKNVYYQNVPTQYLLNINECKKELFQEIRRHFNQKNTFNHLNNCYCNFNFKNLRKLEIGIKNLYYPNHNESNSSINNSCLKNTEQKETEKEKENQFDSLKINSLSMNNNNKSFGNLLNKSVRSVGGIENENKNSTFFEEEKFD
jgi:hypothetical protein